MTKPLWEADEQCKSQSNMRRFMSAMASTTGVPLGSYEDLYEYSISQPEQFWGGSWDLFGIRGKRGSKPWLVQSGSLSSARFFPKGRLNYAENALRMRGSGKALVFWGEDKIKKSLSFDDLRHCVGRFQSWTAEKLLVDNDRIGAVLPNVPEAVIAMLGSSSRGVTWASCSPDFGEAGILDRLGQLSPAALVISDGYYYSGKTIDVSDKMLAVLRKLPSIESVLVVSYIGHAQELADKICDEFGARGVTAETWDAAISARPESEPQFTQLPFSHPLCVLFSSGTTGVPKCIVHSAGGLLLKHLNEQVLHCDLRPNDRLFYFSTLGWMMWNWLVSGLAAGATLLLYDGNPLIGGGSILWDYASAENCTHFGTSAKYIDALAKQSLAPENTHALPALRMILSTGSPLSPESFDYVYGNIKRDVHLASISGGTDICGCFVGCNPLKPVWRGEIQGPVLGMATDITDDEGRSVRGEKGELVCRQPFPSMPTGFWNDADGARYEAAYYTRYPGLWHHGDFAEWTQHDGIIIHGRSDATLNPGGVRIGTAEIYRQVEKLPEIQESIVIGQPWEHDVRVVLFVVLRNGIQLDAPLQERIKKQIRVGASPRHVPAKIIAVNDIPRTRSGKIAELAVRDVVMGRDVKNKEALANPKSLAQFKAMAALNV